MDRRWTKGVAFLSQLIIYHILIVIVDLVEPLLSAVLELEVLKAFALDTVDFVDVSTDVEYLDVVVQIVGVHSLLVLLHLLKNGRVKDLVVSDVEEK